MADPTPQQVRDFIAAGLPCAHLEVEGDGPSEGFMPTQTIC